MLAQHVFARYTRKFDRGKRNAMETGFTVTARCLRESSLYSLSFSLGINVICTRKSVFVRCSPSLCSALTIVAISVVRPRRPRRRGWRWRRWYCINTLEWKLQHPGHSDVSRTRLRRRFPPVLMNNENDGRCAHTSFRHRRISGRTTKLCRLSVIHEKWFTSF